MVAAAEIGPSSELPPPASCPAVRVLRRRFVAVAVSLMELLRPASDLARLVEGADEVDLLAACEDGAADGGAPLGVLSHADHPDYPDDEDDEDAPGGGGPAAPVDEVGAAVQRLGLLQLRVHRLGLRPPLGPGAEGDLVAALSELVGFDPEPGLYCLAPATAPGDPARDVVDRVTQRIAQVYGLPVLRYRCLELSVVTDPG